MRSAYRYLAYTLAALVVVQVAAISYWAFARSKWVWDGGTLTKHAIESGKAAGGAGYDIHSVVGNMVIPVVAIALLLVAFRAKVPNGVTLAAALLLTVVAQIVLASLGSHVPLLGMCHGLGALVLLGGSLYAARVSETAGGRTAA